MMLACPEVALAFITNVSLAMFVIIALHLKKLSLPK